MISFAAVLASLDDVLGSCYDCDSDTVNSTKQAVRGILIFLIIIAVLSICVGVRSPPGFLLIDASRNSTHYNISSVGVTLHAFLAPIIVCEYIFCVEKACYL